LPTHRLAAHNDRRTQGGVAGKQVELLPDLRGQLTGGRDRWRADPAKWIAFQAMEDRQ
jgi:hypothetical protein